ncbi:hypothetical protein O9929_21680 [Vibrio lentus]|nr:hypothetical protein [Vibrio lentus]
MEKSTLRAYCHGEPQAPHWRLWVIRIKTGTEFVSGRVKKPSLTSSSYDILAKRLRRLSFLNSGVSIKLIDKRGKTKWITSNTKAVSSVCWAP